MIISVKIIADIRESFIEACKDEEEINILTIEGPLKGSENLYQASLQLDSVMDMQDVILQLGIRIGLKEGQNVLARNFPK